MNVSKVTELNDLNLFFDLPAAKQKYEETGNFLSMSDIKNKRRPVKIALKGELTNDKISAQVFDGKPSYSFGMILNEDEDLLAFKNFQNLVKGVVPEDWSVKNPAEGDVFYVKLGYDSKTAKFKTKCNYTLNAKKLDSLDLYATQPVTVIASIASWFNVEASTSGVCLKVTEVIFQNE